MKSVPFVKIRPEDILISGKNDEEYLKTLETVLEIISSNGLKPNLKKCMFMQPEVTYLGNSITYRVNKHGIFALPEKVDFSKNVSPLQNVSEFKSFLGLITYYHRHLPSFSTVLEPLHDLFRKNKKWKWGSAEEERFQECKLLLNESNLLIHYDPKKPLLVACDASPYDVGAKLSHLIPNRSEKSIMFASRMLSKAERNYSQIAQDGLTIIFAVKKFHHFIIYGRHFTI